MWQLQQNKRLLFHEAAAQQVTTHSRQRGALKPLCQGMGVSQKQPHLKSVPSQEQTRPVSPYQSPAVRLTRLSYKQKRALI